MCAKEEMQAMADSTGKRIRLNRLIHKETDSSIIIAIDHALTSPVLLRGLVELDLRVKECVEGGANVFMLSRGGAAIGCGEFSRETSLALMLTASAAGRPSGPVITPISSVEEALRLGADAVVVFVALGGENEPEMISYVSKVGEACEALGMPLIAEAEYPNAYQSLASLETTFGAKYLERNARLCAEMGADIVKVNWSGDYESFKFIVEATKKPVVLAGGPMLPDDEFLARMTLAHQAGAIGCSVGRNVFEHANPRAMVRALTNIFCRNYSGEQALVELKAEMGESECRLPA
jgi:DhnA family fructose-bisphosphate aldolase class Ia